MRKGKKVIAWEKERAKCKVRFEAMGIVTCELHYPDCWYNNALSFAHSKKRLNLKPHELSEVILCCTPCHQKIEILPEKEMTKIVRSVIRLRKQRDLLNQYRAQEEEYMN